MPLIPVWLATFEGREASPSAGVIDSHSVKTTESGGITGYDAGKKVKDRKRDIVTDTCGFLIFILVHAADIQDRDGAVDAWPDTAPFATSTRRDSDPSQFQAPRRSKPGPTGS